MGLSSENNNSPTNGNDLRYELTVSFSISLALFLFALFFRPFNASQYFTDNAILFMAGFGGINFLFMSIFISFLPRIMTDWYWTINRDHNPTNATLALIWVFDTVAYGFYIRYVGQAPVSMFLMFKVALLCLGAVAVLKALYLNESLNRQISLLNEKIMRNQEIMDQFETNHRNDVVEIYSDNHSEKISTSIRDLILIRSADNYVEIIYMDEGRTVKKLIRNTLKNMEYHLAKYQKFIRCHRSYIINLDFVDKLLKKYNIYSIRVKDLDEELPVSRQYLLRLREALEKD